MSAFAIDHSRTPPEKVHINDWETSRYRRGTPQCPACKDDLRIVGRSTTMVAHFGHFPGASCPLIPGYARPYNALGTVSPDPAVAAALKSQFLAWHVQIFNKCYGLAKNLDFSEFKKCFDLFHNHNAYRYKDLNIESVPYVLLTFLELFRARPPYRRDHFYFIFEPRLRNFGDLWIDPSTKARTVLQIFPVKGTVKSHVMTQDLPTTSSKPRRGFSGSFLERYLQSKLAP